MTEVREGRGMEPRRWSLVLAACLACAGAQKGADYEEEPEQSARSGGRGEASVAVTYEATAQANWARGEEEFADENYLAAQKYFSHIRQKFPYSAYAAKAELRIGDCYFQRGRFLEAIDQFQNFVRLHSTHQQVSYAMYMTGKAYVEQIPTDWFLLPPSEEKDQAAVRDAANALKSYVDRFPEDVNIEDGKKLLEDARRRLMAHERYAANFYRDRGKPKARAGRLELIKSQFPDVGLDDALLLELTEVYAELGDALRAKATADELAQRFPASPKLAEARRVAAETKAKPEPPPEAP